ncbi:MFS transporter [Kitasatospora sp. NPDC051914]|uniref:MFS transporter n=1 Tax=Kitasatospora sp. NPDC051914 TaxID=3154945 RepID=UPI00343F1B4D
MWVAWSVLGLLYAAAPLFAWCRIARTRQAGPAVAVALLAAAGLLVAAQHGLVEVPRPDAHFLFALAAAALIAVGLAVERAQEGPGPEEWSHRRRGTAGLLAVQVVLALSGGLLYALVNNGASLPPASALPPLPDGLTVISQDAGCGSGNCFRTQVIGSTAGLSRDGIVRRLNLPHETCRANGWLFDRRDRCVGVQASDGRIVRYVSLSDLVG